jgi:hypothetical protein
MVTLAGKIHAEVAIYKSLIILPEILLPEIILPEILLPEILLPEILDIDANITLFRNQNHEIKLILL